MDSTNCYSEQAGSLLTELGICEACTGVWKFSDHGVASFAYIHHSRKPVALVAYSAVDPMFAAGRFPDYTLVGLVDKVPCLDGIEHTALAKICDAPAPIFPSAAERGEIFGDVAWQIVNDYELEGCFAKVRAFGTEGSHYTMRPQGYDYDRSIPIPEKLKSMRKSYRNMSSLQQVMVLTLIHLYSPGTDRDYLVGSCPTKILAAEALRILRSDPNALSKWGQLVSHYAGW